MLYPCPAHWLLNYEGKDTKEYYKLSIGDKVFISQKYPPNSSDIGSFSTLDLRHWEEVSSKPSIKYMAFEPPYSVPPRVALGLSWLDCDHSTDISVSAQAENIYADNFTVSIAPGPDSRLYAASCSWLEMSANEDDVHVGEFDLASAWASGGSGGSGRPQLQTTATIEFPERMSASDAPVVVCWFSALNLGKDAAWRVKTCATDASPFRFRLHVGSSADTDLRGARVTWVAFPRGKEGIVGGTFNTDDIPGLQNSGTLAFPEDCGFEAPPQLMMAVSGLDFECGHNLRLRVSNSEVTSAGLTWHLDSWLDSSLNTATGAYVAICAPKVEDF